MPDSKHYWTEILKFFSIAFLITGFCMLANNYFSYTEQEEFYTEPNGDSDKKVLLLFSYSPTYITEQYVREGVQQSLYKNGITYDCIYMDTKEFGDSESQNRFNSNIEYRLNNLNEKYDGIIACDDDALNFVQNHQNDYFINLPVTFLGINDFDHAKQANSLDNFSGCSEHSYIDKLISTCINLMPNATKIVGIVDSTETAQGTGKQFLSYQKEFSNLSFSTLNTSLMSREDLGKIISKYTDDTILIYLDCIEDDEHNSYSIQENAIYFSKQANIPVFRAGMGGIGEGLVGSIYPDFRTTATLVADELVSMMNGNLKSPDLNDEEQYTYLFDMNVIEEYDLNKNKLPKETQYVNDIESWSDYYGPIVWPIGLCVIGVIFSIISSEKVRRQNVQRGITLNQREQQLKYAMEHDALTGMWNRKVTYKKLNEFLKIDKNYSILIIDVDGLGFINDNFSHSAGDEIVLELSKRIGNYVYQKDGFISHYGGDEFLVAFNNKTFTENSSCLNEILTIAHEPIMAGNKKMTVSVSVGVKNVDVANGNSSEENVLDADIAMYEAKRLGKNRFVIYSKELREKENQEKLILSALEDALINDGFHIVYQPQVFTESKKICGLEALLRLDSGEYSPSQFIPVAVKNGMMVRIGRMIVRKVIWQMSIWKKNGIPLKPVSINYSAEQIDDKEFVHFLENQLKKYDIPTNFIEVEITEDLFIDNTRETVKLFDELKEIGIKLLMDDFGTGYSSLSYLSYIPFDTIKIDKSLVDAWVNEDSKQTMADLIQMAHHLKRLLIAEGVETEEQFKILKELNCDIIQGYYFSKPLEVDKLYGLMNNSNIW